MIISPPFISYISEILVGKSSRWADFGLFHSKPFIWIPCIRSKMFVCRGEFNLSATWRRFTPPIICVHIIIACGEWRNPYYFHIFNSSKHIIRSFKHIHVCAGKLAEKSKMICNVCISIWFTCYLINNLNATYESVFEKKNGLLSILCAFYTHWLYANLQLLGKILW